MQQRMAKTFEQLQVRTMIAVISGRKTNHFYSKKTHKQLLARQKIKKDATASTRDSDTASVNSSECSICLMSIAVSLAPLRTE